MSKTALCALLEKALVNPDVFLQEQRAIHGYCLEIVSDKKTVKDPTIKQAYQTLCDIVPKLENSNVNPSSVFLLIMALSAIQNGARKAITELILNICNPHFQSLDPQMTFGMMDILGWSQYLDLSEQKEIIDTLSPSKQPEDQYARFVSVRLLILFGMKTSRDIIRLRPVLETIAIPWIKECLDKKFFNAALSIDNFLYHGWLKCSEDMDHYQEGISLWAGLYEEAGLAQRPSLPPLNTQEKERPVFGVFIHNASWLAHIQVLHQSLEGLDKNRPYDITLYFLDGHDDDVAKRFAQINVSCVFMADEGKTSGFYDSLLRLRQRCINDGVSVMAWLCLTSLMGMAFGIGLAKRQVYWCMKHNTSAYKTPDDFWVSLNGLNETINLYDIDWKVIPTSYPATQKPPLSNIAACRSQFPKDAIILGTIGREDKLDSPEFLGTICDILNQHPETIYLYTGRENSPSIQNYFATRNLSERVFFIGWIDTRMYSEVFDIYLDSWPARSGMTAFNALEAGKPYVFNVGATGNHNLIATHYFGISLDNDNGIWRIPDNTLDAIYEKTSERTFLAMEGREAYIETVSRLINDEAFRKECGKANIEFSSFLADSSRPAKIVDKLLRENFNISEQKRLSA